MISYRISDGLVGAVDGTRTRSNSKAFSGGKIRSSTSSMATPCVCVCVCTFRVNFEPGVKYKLRKIITVIFCIQL